MLPVIAPKQCTQQQIQLSRGGIQAANPQQFTQRAPLFMRESKVPPAINIVFRRRPNDEWTIEAGWNVKNGHAVSIEDTGIGAEMDICPSNGVLNFLMKLQ